MRQQEVPPDIQRLHRDTLVCRARQLLISRMVLLVAFSTPTAYKLLVSWLSIVGADDIPQSDIPQCLRGYSRSYDCCTGKERKESYKLFRVDLEDSE